MMRYLQRENAIQLCELVITIKENGATEEEIDTVFDYLRGVLEDETGMTDILHKYLKKDRA